jgi:5,10-methylenetetrahydrofolate reductase
MEDKKKQIKEQLEKTVKLSKNLQEPRNDEEQKMLDDIMSEIKDLDNYIDKISTVEDTNGKKYKHVKDKLVDDDGNTYTKSTDDTDYVFSIVSKETGKESKYTVYNKDSK